MLIAFIAAKTSISHLLVENPYPIAGMKGRIVNEPPTKSIDSIVHPDDILNGDIDGLGDINGIAGKKGMGGRTGIGGENGFGIENGIGGENGIEGENGIGGENGMGKVNGILGNNEALREKLPYGLEDFIPSSVDVSGIKYLMNNPMSILELNGAQKLFYVALQYSYIILSPVLLWLTLTGG